jgi:hypothetical protein
VVDTLREQAALSGAEGMGTHSLGWERVAMLANGFLLRMRAALVTSLRNSDPFPLPSNAALKRRSSTI